MDRLPIHCALLVLSTLSPGTLLGQVAGGQSGYDRSLAAIEPTDAAIAVGLAGADPADIARYILAANGAASGARISPDGGSVAFRWSITGEPQLWVVSAEGGQPRRLTYGSGITFFRWVPDGGGLLYGADNDGNEQEAYYTIDPEGATERLVLPSTAGGFRVFGDFLSTSDIVYSSTERNRLDFDIYRADLATGESELVRQGSFAFIAGQASPDGRYVVVSESVGEDSDNLHLLDLASGEFTTLSAPERRANHTNGGIAWLADGTGFYAASNRDREFTALVFYAVDGRVEVVREADRDAGDVTLCGPGDRYLAWTWNDNGYDRLLVHDRETGRDLTAPELPEGVYGVSCTPGAARMAITVNGWRTPGNVYLWDLADGRLVEVFAADMAGLDPDRLIRPEHVSLTARDGVELRGLLYLPDDASRRGDARPPVVFDVHGGPTAQSRPTFEPVAQYHLDRGFAYFEPNVRGSTGYGHTYVTLDDRERRLDSVRDLVDMLEWLSRDGRVDATRAAVVGGSYGGYMVNAVLANYPGHFQAGVSMYGVADWVTALEVASPALKASDRVEYGDIRDPEWQEFYRINSPIRQAERIDVPVLYSHGVMDPRIDIAESEAMVKALRANGVDAPFIRIPDEGHGWRRLSNRLFYFRQQADFLSTKLGLPPVSQ